MVLVQTIFIKDLDVGSVHHVVVLPFGWTSTSWQKWSTGTLPNSAKGSAKSCSWGRNSPMCSVGWGLVGCKIAWQKRPEGSQWTRSWTRASREGHCILGCIRGSIASRRWSSPLPSGGETRTGPWRPPSLAGRGPGQPALVVLFGQGGHQAIPRGPSPQLFSAICGSVISVFTPKLFACKWCFFLRQTIHILLGSV